MGYKPIGPLFCLRALAALALWTLLWINALNAFLIYQILFSTRRRSTMGQEIGQESRHQPAVLWDGSLLHMVFSSNGGPHMARGRRRS
jgi:hypothetical protein